MWTEGQDVQKAFSETLCVFQLRVDFNLPWPWWNIGEIQIHRWLLDPGFLLSEEYRLIVSWASACGLNSLV